MDIIIGHCDTLMNFDRSHEYNFYKLNKKFHVDLPRLKDGNVKIAVFAIFVEPEYKPFLALERTLLLLERFISVFDNNEEVIIIKNYEDIQRVFREGKLGLILSLEGAEAIFDLPIIRLLHRSGVRMVSLTWNQRNHLAEGVGEIKANGGVTRFGKRVLKEMNRLKIIIDTSHLSTASFKDVLEYSDSPVVASHSNVRSVCNHPRNLSDAEIKAIANKGGVIALNFAPLFLSKRAKVEIYNVIEHIDYIKNLVGIDYVALGTDYDGISKTPTGLEDVSKLKVLEKRLIENGYLTSEIKKIFQDNWLRIFREYWG